MKKLVMFGIVFLALVVGVSAYLIEVRYNSEYFLFNDNIKEDINWHYTNLDEVEIGEVNDYLIDGLKESWLQNGITDIEFRKSKPLHGEFTGYYFGNGTILVILDDIRDVEHRRTVCHELLHSVLFMDNLGSEHDIIWDILDNPEICYHK